MQRAGANSSPTSTQLAHVIISVDRITKCVAEDVIHVRLGSQTFHQGVLDKLSLPVLWADIHLALYSVPLDTETQQILSHRPLRSYLDGSFVYLRLALFSP